MGRYCSGKVFVGADSGADNYIGTENFMEIMRWDRKIAAGGNCEYDKYRKSVTLSDSSVYARERAKMDAVLAGFEVVSAPELHVTVELGESVSVFTNMVAVLPEGSKVDVSPPFRAVSMHQEEVEEPNYSSDWYDPAEGEGAVLVIGPPIDEVPEFPLYLPLNGVIRLRRPLRCLDETRAACHAIGKQAALDVSVKLEGW